MNKKILHFVVFSGIILIIGGIITFGYINERESEVVSNTGGNTGGDGGGVSQPVVVTYENVESFVESTSMVRDLPEEGIIRLYIGDVVYSVEKGSMTKGAPSNPDITIRLPDYYLDMLGKKGWCGTLQTANANQDLTIEIHGSKVGTAWKYRELEKYRICLG